MYYFCGTLSLIFFKIFLKNVNLMNSNGFKYFEIAFEMITEPLKLYLVFSENYDSKAE